MKKLLFPIGILLILSLACSLTPQVSTNENTIATSVTNTMQASEEENQQQSPQPPKPTETTQAEDIYNTGTVEGNVCYPSESIPEMYLYLENVNTNEITKVPIPENEPLFSAPVPPGTYTAYAWLPDFNYGGTYSQAVPCGLSVECTDHSLIEFQVTSGQTTSGIQVCDWYGSPSDVPLPPDATRSNSYGSISGELGYPSEGIPPLQIVAFNLGTQQYYYIEVPENTFTYTIENLPPGSYQVVAYPIYEGGEDFGGGYSEYVVCGQGARCTDHSLVTIQVSAGQTTTDVNPVDFYAPEGTFPSNPVP